MTNSKRAAAKGSQRERVFPHRQEILQLLHQGARHASIQKTLGLEDIPKSTFSYLLKRLADEAMQTEARVLAAAARREAASPIAPASAVIREPPSVARRVDPAEETAPPAPKEEASAGGRAGPYVHPDYELPKAPKPKSAFKTVQKRDPKDLY